jgi:hypothetical protein
MKPIIISAAIAVSEAAAHADPVTVMAHTAGASSEEVSSYLTKLDKAVHKVCWEAVEPLISFGLSWMAIKPA